jgi:hypothetical protein
MGAVGVNSLETACSTVNRQHEIKYRCISVCVQQCQRSSFRTIASKRTPSGCRSGHCAFISASRLIAWCSGYFVHLFIKQAF